jgi:autotransporter-associated beta strand protein
VSLDVLIRQLQGALDGKAVKCGSGTLTFPGGSTFTSETTVSHGLEAAPSAVLVTGTLGATMVSVNGVDADSFDVLGCTIDGSTPAAATSGTFYWLAIG